MKRDSDKNEVLDVIEALLRAQLMAIKELRGKSASSQNGSTDDDTPTQKSKRMSQTRMAYDVLLMAKCPLHILEIVSQIQANFGISVSRDTLVSAMIKKVAQGKQFVKTGKNTFGLIGRDEQ